MRRKISENNIFPNYDLYTEYTKIESLISEKQVIGLYSISDSSFLYTLEQYIDRFLFSSWNLRGTFLSIEEMRKNLGLEKVKINYRNINVELVLDFIQYAYNCVFRVNSTIESSSFLIIDKNYINMLTFNMEALLNHLGASIAMDENTNEFYVIYNDDLSIVVSDNHPEISDSITEYNRIDTRGDLKRKGEILCTLFKRLEADEKKFKGTTYQSLCSDTTFLFNISGVRHWVEKDKIASKTFSKMATEELESWYDKTFTMFLSCMVISEYLDMKKEIERIKNIE